MSAIYQILPQLLQANEPLNIFELGAHHGTDTAALRLMFPRARIWAFEPDPRNAYRLRHEPVAKSITIVEAAISDTDGTTTLNLSSGHRPKGPGAPLTPPEPWTYSSSIKAPMEHLRVVPWVKFNETATVKTIRLDTYCAEHRLRQIDFLWADIQGAEDLMIAGGKDTLSRTRLLYTEYADIEMYQGQLGIKGLLERLPGRWQVIAQFEHDVLLKNFDAFSGMYL